MPTIDISTTSTTPGTGCEKRNRSVTSAVTSIMRPKMSSEPMLFRPEIRRLKARDRNFMVQMLEGAASPLRDPGRLGMRPLGAGFLFGPSFE